MTKTFSRRAVIQRAWQTAAALAASNGSVLAATQAPVFLNDPFQLGVASGDPTADGARRHRAAADHAVGGAYRQ
jgi:phosphodiesterase/alkaline phosphatase D-like protein